MFFFVKYVIMNTTTYVTSLQEVSTMTSSWLKRLSAGLALCLTLGFAGCKGGDDADTPTDETQTAQTEETAEAEPTSKVGFIFNSDVDSGLTAQLNEQRIKASAHSDITTCYIENVSITDFGDAVKALCEDGCDYIVSASPVFNNSLTAVASKYMDVSFIGLGRSTSSFNIYACTAQPFQGAYTAGMAAAYNSESEKVGIVADPDMLYTTAVVNAAALGVQLVYQNAELSTAFATKDDEIDAAIDALSQKGCDVIICYTETAHTADRCEELGIKYISSLDCSADAAERSNMLLYFNTNYESFLLSQYKQISLKTWLSDTFTGTTANGCVNISAAQPAAKDGTQDIISALVPKLSNGSAYIFEGQLKDTTGAVRYMQNTMMTTEDIYSMTWYVQGVSVIDNFRQPITDLETNDFEIKY